MNRLADVVLRCSIVLPMFLAASPRNPGEGDVERAEREFTAAETRAWAAYSETMSRAAEVVTKVLDTEMKAATTRGDLDGALRLREKRRRYSTIKSRAIALVPVEGTYAARSTKWGNQDLLLREDRTFGRPAMGKDHENEGKWELGSETLTLRWNDWPAKDLHATAAFTCPDLTMTWKSEVAEK